MYGIQSSSCSSGGGGDLSIVTKSIGHHSHWGISSGFDILEAMRNSKKQLNETNEVKKRVYHILLVNPGDIRHILATISRRRRHDKNSTTLPEINFYLLENPIEILARDITLLSIFCDYEIPIRQRANLFLEVYGNCKVQRRTASYIENTGKYLIDLVRNNRGKLIGLVDLSLLKYREKDALEEAYKRYSKSSEFFDITKLLDHRRRGLYEDRFDSRKALFDWDYHASIKSSASIIHVKQYKEWRESGIAFEFGDQQYTESNKTLLSYTEGTMKKGKDHGIKKEVSYCYYDPTCNDIIDSYVNHRCRVSGETSFALHISG